MRKVFLAALLTGASVSVPAFAQDNSEAFTGFRLEAIGGYDRTTADSDGDFSPGTEDRFDEGSGLEGVLYGVGAGYDFSAGGVVIGAEAELSDSTGGESDDNGFGTGRRASFEVERDIYVGGRIGVPLSPRAMIYAKGGYTNARYGLDADDTAGVTREFGATLDGFRVGGGVELAVSDNVFAKAEYRYSSYSDLSVDVGDTDVDFDDFDVNTDRHQLVAGVGFRF
ncbi:MAG: porin family protein [Sphingomonadaceae bacterium]|nr:porin family protein [Sphingomonadaceae bacterium]